jgi:hypothetical protein
LPPCRRGRKLEAPLSQVNPSRCASTVLILITFSGFLQCDGAVRQFSSDFGAEKWVFVAGFGDGLRWRGSTSPAAKKKGPGSKLPSPNLSEPSLTTSACSSASDSRSRRRSRLVLIRSTSRQGWSRMGFWLGSCRTDCRHPPKSSTCQSGHTRLRCRK